MVYTEVTELKYTVSCANPPSDLKIKEGNKVRVQGIKHKEKITAESIKNLTDNSSECKCTTGWELHALPEEVDVTGLARNVVVSKDSIQFELEIE